MRILYVAMAHDYGNPERGPSFEETNFRSALDGMGHDLVPFDFMERAKAVGKPAMRKELIATAAEVKPDAAFFCLFTDELDTATIEAIDAPTVNWFADDHWRFDSYTRHMAPAFDLAVTTDAASLPKYEAAGIRNVLLSQWACNRYAYGRTGDGIEHDVTFVGQPHGNREEIIGRITAAGHDVECWGFGWPAGKLDHEGMVRVFSTSRVNLNLSNSSTPPNTLRVRVGRWLGRGPKGPQPPQIKGRNFEVPGCGGFLLTERVPHLGEYFELGKEVAVYDGPDDLVEQVGYWLEHDDERAAVADAGYRRVMAEHTYDHRFETIFRALGLGGGS
ncbi:MAG: spore maturation protein CgeB [Thermoleophilaceae bacterium]|nr:spore maturation protein CgeB [Thermoleophilaceae bacterium]